MTTLRDAASIVLLRRCAPRGRHSYEVLLLRRGRGAAFMASAHVFPGGAVEAGETLAQAAVRELHEEAGVLLPDPGALAPWAHWMTPSIEPKRFSAHFFVAECAAEQEVTINPAEMVAMSWVTPDEGLARSRELALPPPQLRTLWEMAPHADIASVVAAAHARATEPHPLLPRALNEGGVFQLLLPWDADYARADGEGITLATTPSWAHGPSRFALVEGAWRYGP